MKKRYVSIWFRYLLADRYVRKVPDLKTVPFVMATPQHGRMVVTAVSPAAAAIGISTAMVVADARAAFPGLLVVDEKEISPESLLIALSEWAIRFTPIVSTDPPDGILLDATGCTHLWKGEQPYLEDIASKLEKIGYHVRVAIAGTPGAAWAAARFGKESRVAPGNDRSALLSLHPAALRLPPETVEKLCKLGLTAIGKFIDMPRSALRRRFGQGLPDRLDKVLGLTPEWTQHVVPATIYREQLECPEPVCTATAIRIALERLLECLCKRLAAEHKGLQKVVLKTFRVDGKTQEVVIGTFRPTCHIRHLMRLFELKIGTIAPGLGIESFILEAPVVLEIPPEQAILWSATGDKTHVEVATLLDRLAGRGGADSIRRFLPAEHHWPERSFVRARSLEEKPATVWQTQTRPMHLLPQPEQILVTAPIPDYPPVLFRYKGHVHQVLKADGPERIEQEWWITEGQHRDYYRVEDESGARYWIFRSGHYEEGTSDWFIHGFFS